MISASSRARVLNGETTMWATRLKNSIIRTSLAPLAAHASPDEVFGKDSGQRFGRMIKKRLPHASSANRSQGLLGF